MKIIRYKCSDSDNLFPVGWHRGEHLLRFSFSSWCLSRVYFMSFSFLFHFFLISFSFLKLIFNSKSSIIHNKLSVSLFFLFVISIEDPILLDERFMKLHSRPRKGRTRSVGIARAKNRFCVPNSTNKFSLQLSILYYWINCANWS